MPPETIKKNGEPSLPPNTQNFRSDFNIYFLISKGDYRFLCSLNLFLDLSSLTRKLTRWQPQQ